MMNEDEDVQESGPGEAPARPTASDYAKVELELEREKVALERERLAHERDKLSLERLKLRSESEIFDHRRKFVVSPVWSLVVALVFLLAGMGLNSLLSRHRRIEVDARQLGAPVIWKSPQDGAEREATAYLLFMK